MFGASPGGSPIRMFLETARSQQVCALVRRSTSLPQGRIDFPTVLSDKSEEINGNSKVLHYDAWIVSSSGELKMAED